MNDIWSYCGSEAKPYVSYITVFSKTLEQELPRRLTMQ